MAPARPLARLQPRSRGAWRPRSRCSAAWGSLERCQFIFWEGCRRATGLLMGAGCASQAPSQWDGPWLFLGLMHETRSRQRLRCRMLAVSSAVCVEPRACPKGGPCFQEVATEERTEIAHQPCGGQPLSRGAWRSSLVPWARRGWEAALRDAVAGCAQH